MSGPNGLNERKSKATDVTVIRPGDVAPGVNLGLMH
jgi:hypothetical protein